MKKIIKVIALNLLTLMMISCGTTNKVEKYEEINSKLICPDGLPAIAISKSIVDSKKIDYMNLEYSILNTTDLLLAEFMKGEAELAVVPSNIALQAYKKNLDYKVMATIGWGSLYLVSTENISDISELKGKEIYNTGKGLTPDLVFKDILNAKGINEDDVQLTYVEAASELAPIIMSGKATYAVLPEPVLSTVMEKNPNIKIILNLNDEWGKLYNLKSGYPQSCLMIKNEFYEKIKGTGLYEDIIKTFEENQQWVINNPQLAADNCEVLGITINKAVIDKSITNSNLKFTEIDKTKEEYNVYFNIIDGDNKGENKEYDSIFIKK